jgi:aspartate kinase
MLSVEKIGGTSMSRFGEILENIILFGDYKKNPYGRVFIVSAYGGVTDMLLEHKKTGAPGVYSLYADGKDYGAALDKLCTRLIEINHGFEGVGLDIAEADRYITERFSQTKSYLDSMAHVLASGYVSRENLLLAGREILACVGEAHAAFNSVNILQNNGLSATLVDLSGFYDSQSLTIDQRIAKELSGIDPNTSIPVVTGYTNGSEGIMREFDRGYSEITFSKVCVELKADEAVIHKEFHLSSADPNIVGPDAITPVGYTNYDVADQLADVGMEAVHPKASKPLERSGMRLRIKNAFDPTHPGTLITKDYIGSESRIEIITGSNKVSAIEIHDPLMVGSVGFDLRILETFRRYRVSYILKSTNANSITHIVWERNVSDALLEELRDAYDTVTVRKVAVVCAIGSNIAKPGVLGEATNALATNGINIEAISQSLRQVNMQFVINRGDYHKAIICLNRELCQAG